MSKNGKIPVVVEPDNHPHEVVDRANWLAGLTACDLHLVLCDLDVVAAVDPVHSYDKPADLDQLIVDNARAITEPTDGDVHLLHTYQRIVEIGTEATRTFKPIELPIEEFSKRIQTEHRKRLDALAVAINTGTNIPSVATPNGQAAFLFLLTSALAPLIRLSYGRMVYMALPYTITMSTTGALALWYLT